MEEKPAIREAASETSTLALIINHLFFFFDGDGRGADKT